MRSVTNTQKTDMAVSKLVKQNEKEFFNKYEHLKPVEIEEESWWQQRIEDWSDFWSNTGDKIASLCNGIIEFIKYDFCEMFSNTGEYIKKTLQEVIFGKFYEGNITITALIVDIAAGIVGVDILMDFRDLYFDFTHWGQEDGFILALIIDIIAILPVIGAVKYLKYADEIKEVEKAGETIHDSAKVVNNISQVAENAKKNRKNE